MLGRVRAPQGALRHSREHFIDTPTFGVSGGNLVPADPAPPSLRLFRHGGAA